ncbi:hypothetical protein GCM10028895_25650 [Pontibacter rugosus]
MSIGKHQLSYAFVKAALFFLVLSSLGPWAMGPIMATGQSGSELYFNAIYFYLHFQYNGWFTFTVLGLLFWLLEHYKFSFSPKYGRLFFRLMFWSCLPAYLLSVLWSKPAAAVYAIGGAAALAQVIGLVVLLLLVKPINKQVLALFGNWSRFILILAGMAFTAKFLMQLATATPYMANLVYRLRFFIIGYLHLVLIGFVSLFMLAFFAQQGWVSFKQGMSRWGMGMFLAAFVGTEILLFLQGIFFWLGVGAIPVYHKLLFGLSISLPVGILLFFVAQVRREKACLSEGKVAK